MEPLSRSEVLELLGPPSEVAHELREFGKTAKVFSSKRANLIAKYAKRWVAVLDGAVVADGKNLAEVLANVDQAGADRKRVLIRYVDRTTRKMIL